MKNISQNLIILRLFRLSLCWTRFSLFFPFSSSSSYILNRHGQLSVMPKPHSRPFEVASAHLLIRISLAFLCCLIFINYMRETLAKVCVECAESSLIKNEERKKKNFPWHFCCVFGRCNFHEQTLDTLFLMKATISQSFWEIFIEVSTSQVISDEHELCKVKKKVSFLTTTHLRLNALSRSNRKSLEHFVFNTPRVELFGGRMIHFNLIPLGFCWLFSR